MSDVQARVQGILDGLVESGKERGLQVAAYLDGNLVVDAWSGVADPATGREVDGDSLFTVFSVTKGVTATAFHMLAERGVIDYNAPIVRYWPQFGAHGKERATVRQALTHTVGVPRMPEDVTPEDLCDWDKICTALAEQVPAWEPGTRTGYHAYTWGWILGEIVRRAEGRTIADIVRDDIARPLGIDDSLFFGISDEAEPRVAPLEDGGWLAGQRALPAGALLLGAIPLSVTPSAEVHNRPDVRRASIPAGGGIMSARAVARMYAALARGGEIDGVRLLSLERIKLATELQTDEVDAALGAPIKKALGYFLGGPLSPMSARTTAFGHPGVGGAIAFADPEHRFAFALTKNRLTVDPPGDSPAYTAACAIREALGIPHE
jgi:CubicO group peptidase (beta-lactamase class C family)